MIGPFVLISCLQRYAQELKNCDCELNRLTAEHANLRKWLITEFQSYQDLLNSCMFSGAASLGFFALLCLHELYCLSIEWQRHMVNVPCIFNAVLGWECISPPISMELFHEQFSFLENLPGSILSSKDGDNSDRGGGIDDGDNDDSDDKNEDNVDDDVSQDDDDEGELEPEAEAEGGVLAAALATLELAGTPAKWDEGLDAFF